MRRLCYTHARGGARKRVWFPLRSLASQLRTCRVSSQLKRYDAPHQLVGDWDSRGNKGQGPTSEGRSSQSEPLEALTFQLSSTKISWQGSAHWRLPWASGCSCDPAGGKEEPWPGKVRGLVQVQLSANYVCNRGKPLNFSTLLIYRINLRFILNKLWSQQVHRWVVPWLCWGDISWQLVYLFLLI